MCCCFMLSHPPSDGTRRGVRYVLDKSATCWINPHSTDKSAHYTSSPRRAHHPLVQTFPVGSVMHERNEDITAVDFTLTEPSQMIGGQGRVATGDSSSLNCQ